MFECNKCQYEETERCNYCYEDYKPSEWVRKREDIKEIMTINNGIDIRKCNK